VAWATSARSGEGDDRPVALGERVRDGGEALDLPALERDPVVALAGPGVHDDERPPRAARREERAHTRAIRVRDRQPPGGRRPGRDAERRRQAEEEVAGVHAVGRDDARRV
jgi:hypothetical protein